MKKVTKEELNGMKKELEALQKSIKNQEKELEELKKNEHVISFIYANHEYQKTLNKIDALKEEIPYCEMLNCEHYFMITETNSWYDGHRSGMDYIVTCVKCGLTNKYLDKRFIDRDDPWNVPYIKMNEAYEETHGTDKTHGYCDYDEIDFYKNEYTKFKNEYPHATNDDVEEHINLIKKMKEGKK